MNNVIGSEDQALWYTANCYRNSINFMREKDITKFKLAIEKEKNIYKSLLNELLHKAA